MDSSKSGGMVVGLVSFIALAVVLISLRLNTSPTASFLVFLGLLFVVSLRVRPTAALVTAGFAWLLWSGLFSGDGLATAFQPNAGLLRVVAFGLVALLAADSGQAERLAQIRTAKARLRRLQRGSRR